MTHSALTVGLSDELFMALQSLVSKHGLAFTVSPTVWEAGQLLLQQNFQLLIVDLDYLRSVGQVDWLMDIRRMSFLPVIILTDTPEQDAGNMIHLGADMCISGKDSYSVIHAYAQLRRYTEYNHYADPANAEAVPFRVGDFFIDPARRIVEVCGRLVNLRPREFSLLLYFMRNPHIVLTSEQICEHAWGMEGSYNQGVAHPIRLLRKAIEPDPPKPIYIETVHRVGYRFTACKVETCDMC